MYGPVDYAMEKRRRGVQSLVFAGGSGNPPLDGDGIASCHMAGYRAVRSDRKERGRDILERM